MAERKKKIIKRTPVGLASFPWLTKADTKFDVAGEYKVDLIFEADVIEELKDELDALLDTFFEEQKAEAKPQVAKIMKKVSVGKDVFDDQGDETGQVMLRFKQKAQISDKAGKVYAMTVNGFDSVGKPLAKDVAVYGGSELKVNFEAVPYMSAKDKECGLTLRLRAYQVITLNSGSSGSASSFGFDAEEGFEQDDGFDERPTSTQPPDEDDDF